MDKPTVLVFGGAGGIGAAVVRKLSDTARIVIASRSQERLESVAAETGALPFIADVTEPGATDAAVEFARSQTGRLDGVVHCVGSILLKAAHQTSDAEWSSVLTLNLTSAFFALRSGAKAMMSSGGSIVLMSSAAGRFGLPNHEAIAAAKAGIIGLTQAAAATYSRYGIRVNCVAPGLVRTPLSARITGNEASLKASEAMHALGRIGEPEEVAEVIVHLLWSKWITGQTIGVDGGLATVKSR
ncbi:MAG: SDR family oxidoreductase [Bryobacteraceae bacterium]|nr:SDR family oxidoreductase [Bryobacteraceae bacterium]